MKDLVLPAFEMDCRDWLVLTPAQAGLPDEVAGAPLLAVLSTLVIGDDSLLEASGVLTIGLLEDELPRTRPMAGDCVAAELLDVDDAPDSLQYVLATPDGQLALLAEFTTPDGADGEVGRRIELLMKSFRWAV
ncbi:MAG: hypothetical protein DLM57_14290 [Pseudonocardiales bacterium]|nr:MAG: hypothetical protein DLM57_14290 [Pseudonocardiales bacterium]